MSSSRFNNEQEALQKNIQLKYNRKEYIVIKMNKLTPIHMMITILSIFLSFSHGLYFKKRIYNLVLQYQKN